MPLKGRAQSAGFVGDSTPIVFSLPFEATHWVQQLVGNGSPGMNRDQIEGNQAIQRQGEGAGRKLTVLIRAAHRAPNQDYRKIDYIDIAILVP